MKWNTKRIEVKGANIKVIVNGKQKIDFTDSDPIERGKIGMLSASCRMRFDDVRVTK